MRIRFAHLKLRTRFEIPNALLTIAHSNASSIRPFIRPVVFLILALFIALAYPFNDYWFLLILCSHTKFLHHWAKVFSRELIGHHIPGNADQSELGYAFGILALSPQPSGYLDGQLNSK